MIWLILTERLRLPLSFASTTQNSTLSPYLPTMDSTVHLFNQVRLVLSLRSYSKFYSCCSVLEFF